MSVHRRCSLLLGLILASLPALPLAAGGAASNVAVIDAAGADDAAASVCQVVVLVNSVIIVEPEDGLGLATRLSPDPVVVDVPSGDDARHIYAECEVVIGKLRILQEELAGFGSYLGNYVSGPPAIHAGRTGVASNNLIVRLEGSQASIAVCQLVVVVNSVILGGGAAGFETGDAPSVLRIENSFHAGDESRSRCHVDVGEVEVK